MVLGRQTERPRPAEGEEDEQALELPFSVELGAAQTGARAFAVPAIENRKGANFAVLATMDAISGQGSVLELGRVYGDVEPPVVAPFGEHLLLAVPEGTGLDLSLRLVLVKPPYAVGDVRRGVELTGVRRDDPAYSLAVREKVGVLAYNTLVSGQGRIAVTRIDPFEVSLRGAPALLPGSSDVSGPRLVVRTSGFYLAYLARPAAPLTPGASPESEDPGPDTGASALEIMMLDEQGAPSRKPLRVSPPGAKVLAFELAPFAGDSALLVYRDARGLGLEQEGAQAILVRPDGTFERRRWEVGESSGVPSLLMDPASASRRRGFVALAGEGDTKLAPIGADPLALGTLAADPGLAHAEPLAVRGNRFLSGTVHGTERRLAILDCSRVKSLQ